MWDLRWIFHLFLYQSKVLINLDSHHCHRRYFLAKRAITNLHTSNENESGSNDPDHFIKSPMRSTIIIIFPPQTLFNQPIVGTCRHKDAMVSLIACHIHHDVIILIPCVNKYHGRSTVDIPLIHWWINSSHHVVDFLCHWNSGILPVHPPFTSYDDVSEIYDSDLSPIL
jgi:hypothetical protein